MKIKDILFYNSIKQFHQYTPENKIQNKYQAVELTDTQYVKVYSKCTSCYIERFENLSKEEANTLVTQNLDSPHFCTRCDKTFNQIKSDRELIDYQEIEKIFQKFFIHDRQEGCGH